MILVTGAGGQLGQELRNALAGREALFMKSAELDIRDADACKKLMLERRVSIVVNAAAYTKVDKAESEQELAFAVNRDGALNMAVAAQAAGARVIHISTDYVFDGHKLEPYLETDAPNPQTIYGQSKLEGEKAVMAHAPRAIILRTGWLYSAYEQNFLKTMLRLGAERTELGVVSDQVGTPTHAAHLARDIVKILDAGHGEGIYHYADGGEASWFDFATQIMKEAALPCKVKPIATSDYPTPAVRPAYSVLDKGRVKREFNVQINDWQDDIKTCVNSLRM